MFENVRKTVSNIITRKDIFSGVSVFTNTSNSGGMTNTLTAYQLSLYANKAINKRGEKVGEIEFELKNARDEDVTEHWLLDLLEQPNKLMSGAQFFALYQKYYDIFGEVYIQLDVEKRIAGDDIVNNMYLLRSDKVKPKFNNDGTLASVDHHTAKGTVTIPGDEIIYDYNPDPVDPRRGESLLASGIRQIETSSQIDEYQAKVLRNGGRVEGILRAKGNLTRTQVSEIKDQYNSQYAEATKAGKPLVLGGDMEYMRLGLDPAELAYLQTKSVLLNDIILLTGVPKAILGISSDETFANSDAAIRVFLSEVIRPLMDSITKKLNTTIVPEELELTFIDPTPENKEERRKDIETGIKNYVLTPNEARDVIGYEPIEGGDNLMAPFNIAPLATERPSTESKAVTKTFAHPLSEKATRRMYHAMRLKQLDAQQAVMERVLVQYFNEQKGRVLKPLTQKSLLTEIFNTTLEIKLAKEAVLPVLATMLAEAGQEASDNLDYDWDFHATPAMDAWLDTKVAVFAEQITNTTFKQLKKQFDESAVAGEDRSALIARIENTYDGISEGRAAVIARTEVHGVTQYGTQQGYKQAGLPIKIWVWAPGVKGGVRDDHAAMDGEEQPVDTTFSNGLMFPGDPSGGAAETVNCECFI